FVGRLQTGLSSALGAGTVPAFTASFGIADSTMTTRVRHVARLADEALYRAKDAGRNRSMVADPHGLQAARHATEHSAAIDVAMLDTGSFAPTDTGSFVATDTGSYAAGE